MKRLPHDTLTDIVADRLQNKGTYDYVCRYQCYDVNGAKGEMDIVAVRGNNAHYYEVKTSHNNRACRKASEQFARAQIAFPSYRWKFVLVTNDGVERVRL